MRVRMSVLERRFLRRDSRHGLPRSYISIMIKKVGMNAVPETMRFLPVGLDVNGRKCLVVGGGSVGTRKVTTLLLAGAELTVASPTVSRELAGRIERGEVSWESEPFRESHLERAFLVVTATNDDSCNRTIAGLAAERGVLVCDASSAERSDVIFGALLRQDGVTVAVFTDGRDPALARKTRDRIGELFARPDPPDGV